MDYLKKLQEEVKMHTKEKENKEAKALAKQKAKATPKAFPDDSDDEPYAKSGCMSDSGCKTSASKYGQKKDSRKTSGYHSDAFGSSRHHRNEEKQKSTTKVATVPQETKPQSVPKVDKKDVAETLSSPSAASAAAAVAATSTSDTTTKKPSSSADNSPSENKSG